MMKKFQLVLFGAVLPLLSVAQNSRFTCPAAAAFVRECHWCCSCSSQCSLAGVGNAFCCVLLPFGGDKSSAFSLEREHWGDLRALRSAASYAQSFAERFSFALLGEYNSISFSDPYYGKLQGFSLSFSSFFQPDSRYSLGMQWENPFGFSYHAGNEGREKMPSSLCVVGVYSGLESFCIAVGIDKVWQQPFCCRLLLEHSPASWLWCGFGCGFPGMQFDAGVGVAWKQLNYGLVCVFRQGWGASLQVSVSRTLPDKWKGVFRYA